MELGSMTKRRSNLLSLSWMIIFTFGTVYISDTNGAKRSENRLLKDLLKDYDVNERPVRNASDIVDVKLRLLYRQLVNLDEPKQLMKSLVWLKMTWKDVNLKWNASEYDGYSTIRIDPSRIWKPDLTLYNNVHEDGGNLHDYKTKITLNANGTAFWLAPAILQSICRIDISKFPFDKQKCHLKIGSWTYDSLALAVNMETKDEPNINNYKSNTEWELVSAYAERSLPFYQCCPIPFYDITYTFVLHRKPLYYIMAIIFPCILLSLLATISFLFPADSGERISLVISVLLGIIVFMLIVNDRTPVTSETVPMITIYFNASVFLVFLTLVDTAVVLRMSYASALQPVTGFLKKYRDFAAFVLCMKKSSGRMSKRLDLGELFLADAEQWLILREQMVDATKRNKTIEERILIELRKFSKRLAEEDSANEIREDWKYTGRVLDKLCFCYFLLSYIAVYLFVISYMHV